MSADWLLVAHGPASPDVQAWGKLAASASRAASIMAVFANVMRAAQEGEYLTAHRRLPGSTRTKRLRKKRADRVSAWWRANT